MLSASQNSPCLEHSLANSGISITKERHYKSYCHSCVTVNLALEPAENPLSNVSKIWNHSYINHINLMSGATQLSRNGSHSTTFLVAPSTSPHVPQEQLKRRRRRKQWSRPWLKHWRMSDWMMVLLRLAQMKNISEPLCRFPCKFWTLHCNKIILYLYFIFKLRLLTSCP